MNKQEAGTNNEQYGESLYLPERILQRREADAIDESQVIDITPGFIEELKELFFNKYFGSDIIRRDSVNGREEWNLIRTFDMPLDNGTSPVTISISTEYKGEENYVLPQLLRYKIDIEELDEVLIVGGEEGAVVQSKEQKKKDFDEYNTPIGNVTVYENPVRSRKAKVEDIQRHRKSYTAKNYLISLI